MGRGCCLLSPPMAKCVSTWLMCLINKYQILFNSFNCFHMMILELFLIVTCWTLYLKASLLSSSVTYCYVTYTAVFKSSLTINCTGYLSNLVFVGLQLDIKSTSHTALFMSLPIHYIILKVYLLIFNFKLFRTQNF